MDHSLAGKLKRKDYEPSEGIVWKGLKERLWIIEERLWIALEGKLKRKDYESPLRELGASCAPTLYPYIRLLPPCVAN